MTQVNVLMVSGWISLIISWVFPYMMKKLKKNELDSYFFGATLAAFSCGIFISALILTLMK